MKKTAFCLANILLVLSLTLTLGQVQVAAGVPDSAEFAFGARLNLWGEQVLPAVTAAAGMNLDWIALDFDWSRQWPDSSALPDLNTLSQVMSQAQTLGMPVLISIVRPPAWAMTPTGPDAALTATLVVSLARLYPGVLMAIELFPGPNTPDGWGTAPNPAAYAALLQTTLTAVQQNQLDLLVVAGGFSPLPNTQTDGSIDDLLFLQELYRSGAAGFMPIVGVRFSRLTGDPMSLPTGDDHRFLRHFEEVRRVMAENNHQSGLIWITGFSWPNGTINPNDAAYQFPDVQARWLGSAYRLMRAQLYIGAAFFTELNPASAESSSPASLLQPDGSLHPASERLTQLTGLSGNTHTVNFIGNISKHTPLKLDLKPDQP